jgi:hypothetical protein
MIRCVQSKCVSMVLGSIVGFSATSAAATVTWGNLSNGKFYRLSVAPSASYPDRWGNEFTDGAKLTDEQAGAS